MSQKSVEWVEWSLAALALLVTLSFWPGPPTVSVLSWLGVASLGTIVFERLKVRFPHYGFTSAAPAFLVAASFVPDLGPSRVVILLALAGACRVQAMADTLPAFLTLMALALGLGLWPASLLFLTTALLYPMFRSQFFLKLPGQLVYRTWPFHLIGACVVASWSLASGGPFLFLQFGVLLGAVGLIRSHRGMNLDTAHEQEAQRLQGQRLKEYAKLLDAMSYSLHEEAVPKEVLLKVCEAMVSVSQADRFALMERDGPRWRLVEEKGVGTEKATEGFTRWEKQLLSEEALVRLKSGWAGESHAVLIPWETEAAVYLGRKEKPLESLTLVERLGRIGAAALRTAHQKLQRDALSEYKAKLQSLYDQLQEAHTELEQSQSDLIQAKKLAAVGQLAAGVAHELNSPFQAISLHLDLIRASLSDPDDVECWETIGEALERCRVIVKELLNFSRRPQKPPELLDLSRTLNLAASDAGVSGVPIDCPEDLTLKGHEHELVSLVTNLLSNARDAVGENPERKIRVLVEGGPENVVISVQDRGEGMSQETQERIFEPFYTTKAVGSGTGLGLYMVFTYVTNAGGTLSVESELGKGTTFRVSLPNVVF